jgi:alanyl-tRNA synthetase
MGLERLASLLQGVISNYDTDLFVPLIKRAAELTGTSLKKELEKETHANSAASLRVVADHSRAATFLISDGVVPSNEGRGYVLRKIIRRAITHGRLLGQTKPFLHAMVFAVRDLMQDAYPELKETCDRVSKAVLAEETRFAHTLELGLKKLEEDLLPLVESRRRDPSGRQTYSGDKAFKLYDTFGMPLDFMQDAARDQGIAFDQTGFDAAMEEQRQRAKASWKGAAKQTANPAYQKLPTSTFEGYRQTRSDGSEVLAIIKGGQGAQELKPGEEGEVILDHTPFYAEAGGQVGDRGWLYSDDHNTIVADVKGCYYPVQGVRAHQVVAKQAIRIGQKVDAVVDTSVRAATMRNHTATHLLHAGLREVLGKHVKQAGSLVAPNHLRFDFSHFTAVEDEELQDIEDLINKEVLRNQKVETIADVPIDTAVNEYHAMALFGEKYGDKVRVVKIGDFSTELCGGTHTLATGEIGLIKVLKEGSVSSGVRRVEAVTGEGSLVHFRKDHQLENVVASIAAHAEGTTPADALRAELDKKDAEIKRLARELDQARMKSASSTVASVNDKIKDVRGVKVLAHRVDNLERSQMRTLVDQLRDKLGSGVVVLGSATDGNVSLIASVTKDLTARVQAGKVIAPVAQKVGGKGGGRPDMAEAGGKDPGALDSALAEVYNVVETLLGS